MSDANGDRTQSLEELLAEMRAKAEAEKRDILQAAEARSREIEENSRRECEGIERDALAEVEAELAAERDRILGEVRTETRSERLALKRTAMQEVLAEAKSEIERRIGGDGYDTALSSLIREGVAFVGSGAEGVVSEQDLALVKKITTSEGLDCRFSGGPVARGSLVLTSSDGRRRVENGLQARLARAHGALSAQVARVLFGEG